MQVYEVAILIYLGAICAVSFVAFALDKLFAVLKRYRISEAFLLTSALLGGSFGALLAMVLFHHKISKPKFRYTIPLLVLVQFALVILYLFQSSFGF